MTMLKREHLLYRITSPYIKPRFADPASVPLQELADKLICLYSGGAENNLSRHELSAASDGIIRNYPDVKVASGINKLLLDRCEFTAAEDVDYPAKRQEAFLKSAALLSQGVTAIDELQKCAGGIDLYGDLPDFEKLSDFAPLTTADLLNRYNLALPQGLLLNAVNCHLEIRNTDNSELRKLLKSIKFFRLMGKFTAVGKKQIDIDISGPYSIFGPSAKYALQLANLLPAIVNLTDWRFTAKIRIKERELTLKLSPENHLVSHYRNLAAYIPEEIRLFHRVFKEKSPKWEITGDTPLLDGGNQEIIFPDLSFKSLESGKICHLELFHRWHTAGLSKRIALLAQKPDLPLIIGIDRALVRDEAGFDALFADAPQIKERCWLFRDFPGVTATLNALKRFERSSASK